MIDSIVIAGRVGIILPERGIDNSPEHMTHSMTDCRGRSTWPVMHGARGWDKLW
ncbi:hypothetical protein BN2364_1365 [Alloalcanivorax xenomutans]|nr:hypothetical protein BN2364_1365 [Alloalcanivorax xenomutans]